MTFYDLDNTENSRLPIEESGARFYGSINLGSHSSGV